MPQMNPGDLYCEDKILRSDGKIPHILIVGGGVSGLTTAWALRKSGCKVTVIAKQYAPTQPGKEKLISEMAGGLWEWAPSVYGSSKEHLNDYENYKRWCQPSYVQFEKLHAKFGADVTGVRSRMSCFLFDKKIENIDESAKLKMLEIKEHCDGFYRGVDHLVEKYRINTNDNKLYNFIDGYEYFSYVIDPKKYLKWLKNHVQKQGVRLLKFEVVGNLLEEEENLLDMFQADVIVNCSGLASIDLCQDKQLIPTRSILLHAKNDGVKFPMIKSCVSIYKYDNASGRSEASQCGDDRYMFMVPRNDKVVVIGGATEMHNGEEAHSASEATDLIQKQMKRLYPQMENAQLLDYDYHIGVQKSRKHPRVGRDDDSTKLFHNYGHGYSRYSLSYGCALDIRKAIRQHFAEYKIKSHSHL
ncbi:hypothetical protein K7432_012821 [Basidiobolus ranarum]|uniref:FAD dependent oxidoreductase domain-containing protein n=1 Tax=Basidiobolus ranarum TaxID=34480 RepID=A0ABR2VRP7_9FUNG